MSEKISASKLALWRAAIAIAYADGRLSDKEKKLLAARLPQRGISDEQKQIIEKDLAKGVKLEEVFPQITDSRDRAHLINFARQLIQADGKPDPSEEAAIEYITSHHAQKLESGVELTAAKLEAKSLNDSYKRQLRREGLQDSFDPWHEILNNW